MLTIENLNQKNYLPQNFFEENSADDKKSDEFVIFSKAEWKHFIDEVNKQIAKKVPVDFSKAARNARYLAELDKSIQQGNEGKIISFTEEDWEKFTDEQELY